MYSKVKVIEMTNWKLQSYSNHKGSHCEVCGKGITHNWFITDGYTTMRVGTDCMFQYTGISNLKEQKKYTKLYQMANGIYNKRAVNYGDDFKSFWIDYHVNIELQKIIIEPIYKSVHNVWKYFWYPYQNENDNNALPY